MTDHGFLIDVPAPPDTAQQHIQRLHLHVGKVRRAVIVQLDPDRLRVHIRNRPPPARTCMPRAAILRDQLRHGAIPRDDVMGRNLMLLLTQPTNRRLCTVHRRVMDNDQRGVMPPPVTMICRWSLEDIQAQFAATQAARISRAAIRSVLSIISVTVWI